MIHNPPTIHIEAGPETPSGAWLDVGYHPAASWWWSALLNDAKKVEKSSNIKGVGGKNCQRQYPI